MIDHKPNDTAWALGLSVTFTTASLLGALWCGSVAYGYGKRDALTCMAAAHDRYEEPASRDDAKQRYAKAVAACRAMALTAR